MFRKFIINIKRWFSYYKVVSKIYDFDYSSILEVERYQLLRVRDCINHYKSHIDAETDLEKMNIALRLLDIIEDYSINNEVGYVNTRNIKRFCKNPELFPNNELLKEYLRTEKAWYLYHKLRLYYLRQWWD